MQAEEGQFCVLWSLYENIGSGFSYIKLQVMSTGYESDLFRFAVIFVSSSSFVSSNVVGSVGDLLLACTEPSSNLISPELPVKIERRCSGRRCYRTVQFYSIIGLFQFQCFVFNFSLSQNSRDHFTAMGTKSEMIKENLFCLRYSWILEDGRHHGRAGGLQARGWFFASTS